MSLIDAVLFDGCTVGHLVKSLVARQMIEPKALNSAIQRHTHFGNAKSQSIGFILFFNQNQKVKVVAIQTGGRITRNIKNPYPMLVDPS